MWPPMPRLRIGYNFIRIKYLQDKIEGTILYIYEDDDQEITG